MLKQYSSIVSPSFASLGTSSPMRILPECKSVRMKVRVLVCTPDTSGFCVSVSLFHILIYRRSNPFSVWYTFSYCKYSIEEAHDRDCERMGYGTATRDQLSPWSSPSTRGRCVFPLHNSVDGTTYRSGPRCAAMTATQTEHPRPTSSP